MTRFRTSSIPKRLISPTIPIWVTISLKEKLLLQRVTLWPSGLGNCRHEFGSRRHFCFTFDCRAFVSRGDKRSVSLALVRSSVKGQSMSWHIFQPSSHLLRILENRLEDIWPPQLQTRIRKYSRSMDEMRVMDDERIDDRNRWRFMRSACSDFSSKVQVI